MAKNQFLTGHQKGIVNRYYQHKGTIGTQKASEIVSELYLETNPKKIEKLWASTRTALLNAGCNQVRVNKLCDEKNLSGVAKLVEETF